MFRLDIFSIDWRLEWGERTAAGPDGRAAGEPLSQNASAVFGACREGMTAHILSVTELDAADAVNGTVLDLDLHLSACRGEKGLEVLLTALETFLARGGGGIHFNVLSSEVLEDAQRRPERYQNLQVRVCGWNERFLSMSEEAQNEFIRRARHLEG